MPVALVTGGAKGIGRGIGRALAAAGFDVASAALETEAEAQPALDEVRAAGRRALYVRQDLADVDAHGRLVDRVRDALGPIDCLVNNAGVTSLRRGDMLALGRESFDRTLGVNVRGTYFLTQSVARSMLAHPAPDGTYRSIVTITSANAEIVGLARADYCISKAALSMMSKLFAARLAAEGIHVFELRPGIVRTDMTAPVRESYDAYIAGGGVPLRRWGTPDDVGAAVATIARGLLPFATGEVLNVGGGLHLHRV